MDDAALNLPDADASAQGGRTEVVQADGATAVAVAVENDGLMVMGDREAVSSYLERVKAVGGATVRVSGVNGKAFADAAAVGASVAGLAAANTAGLVRLSPASLELLKSGNLVQGTNGFNRMFVTGGDGLIKGQLQWQTVAMGPEAALALQSAMVAASLRTAIASVEAAVEKVQDSVDVLLTLAKADWVGDVVGHHETLEQVASYLDEHGSLASTEWDGIAGLRPQLEAGVAKLREHINQTLAGFDVGAPVQERAEYMRKAVKDDRLGESLQLLLVAEDSLYLWHRLRIERVRTTEPDHIEAVVVAARKILADHLAQDGEIVQYAGELLSEYAKAQPLEYFRRFSASSLRKDVNQLRADVDAFAEARRGQVAEWVDHESPTFSDVVDEIGRRVTVGGALAQSAAKELAARTLDVGAIGLDRVGGQLQRVAERRIVKQDEASGDRRDATADGD